MLLYCSIKIQHNPENAMVKGIHQNRSEPFWVISNKKQYSSRTVQNRSK